MNMISTIQKFKDCLNAHDLDGVRVLGTPDTQIDLGGLVMGFTTDYLDVMEEAFASFPDMQFTGDVVMGDDDKVHWKNVTCMGTHTGAPYGFGPYPKIEAKGTKCSDEIQEMELEVENGKITSAKLIPFENALSGPPRFYTQIGGKLDESPKE